MKNLVWRLLRKNLSKGQIAAYALANLVGLSVVLVALQFYRDVSATTEADDPFLNHDYLVMSKQVNAIGSLLGGPTTLSQSDLRDLRSQPWAERVGEFTAAEFDVNCAVELGGGRVSSALFFESIPDEFFDIRPEGWDFDPMRREIPIVLSKDYLALYNFGFAAARGLPQLTEGMIGMVPLRVSVSGNGRQEYFTGRIVGFSSRLNTIAVPQAFMDWANGQFGAGGRSDAAGAEAVLPSRVIIEVSDPGNPAIEDFARSHGLEIAGDKADSGRAAYFLSVLTAVVVSIGLVISALAVFVLMLSIFLLLQRNRDKLRSLMDLGYTPADVARRYEAIVVWVNAAVAVLAGAATLIGATMWQSRLEAMGAPVAAVWPTLLVGLGLISLITAANILAIRHKVRSYWR